MVHGVMWYMGGAVHWWGWLVATFVTLLFWGAIAAAVLFLVRSATTSSRTRVMPHGPDDSPERIVARRFAAGEIDEDEFAGGSTPCVARPPQRAERRPDTWPTNRASDRIGTLCPSVGAMSR